MFHLTSSTFNVHLSQLMDITLIFSEFIKSPNLVRHCINFSYYTGFLADSIKLTEAQQTKHIWPNKLPFFINSLKENPVWLFIPATPQKKSYYYKSFYSIKLKWNIRYVLKFPIPKKKEHPQFIFSPTSVKQREVTNFAKLVLKEILVFSFSKLRFYRTNL